MLTLLMALAAIAEPQTPPQAAIEIYGGQGIRDWEADGDKGLWLRDQANRWFYAKLTAPCPAIQEERTIEFDTAGSRRFDRSGRVITRTMTCAVESLTASAPPPSKGG